MAYGGGTFLTMNKILAGAYINFVSKATATATLGDRGIAAIALPLDWGAEDAIFEVTSGDFQKNSMKYFGYDWAAPQMRGLRDLFQNIKKLYVYRLTSGGEKAVNTYASAKYCGSRGNDLKIVIQKNVDNTAMYDVATYLGNVMVDMQTVNTASALVDNDYVSFGASVALQVTAGMPLAGGTNGDANAAAHQAFLDALESYPDVNAVGYVGNENTIKALYAAFTRRMRDEVGIKFQTVLYNYAADYEGCVNVKNKVNDGETDADLVYWVTGIIAGTAINASATNNKYNGEFDVDVKYTQIQLEQALKAGYFCLHAVGSDIRVLDDINSFVTISDVKGEVFSDNQTIRVIDEIAMSIASVFVNKYLGNVPNDASGRISLWTDIIKHHRELEKVRAIEEFDDADVVVEQGDTKKAVVVTDAVQIVNTMAKLYMTVTVS